MVDWLVSWLILGVLSLARVGDISNISIVSVNIVGHSLDTTIRQGHTVASLGHVSVSRLVSIVVGSTVAIIDSVVVAVDSGFTVVRLDIGRSSVSWSHNSSLGSDGAGEDDDDLKYFSLETLKLELDSTMSQSRIEF